MLTFDACRASSRLPLDARRGSTRVEEAAPRCTPLGRPPRRGAQSGFSVSALSPPMKEFMAYESRGPAAWAAAALAMPSSRRPALAIVIGMGP